MVRGSPSSKKLIIGNPEFRLDFSLSFLDEFLYVFPRTFFLLFGLWLGVARSTFLGLFKHWIFLYFDSRINNFPRIDAVLGLAGGRQW